MNNGNVFEREPHWHRKLARSYRLLLFHASISVITVTLLQTAQFAWRILNWERRRVSLIAVTYFTKIAFRSGGDRITLVLSVVERWITLGRTCPVLRKSISGLVLIHIRFSTIRTIRLLGVRVISLGLGLHVRLIV